MTTETNPNSLQTASRRRVILWLVISQLLALASLVPWFLVATISLMAFDSGVSTQAIVLVSVIYSYPLVVLVFAIIAWLSYRAKNDRRALIVTSLFLIGPVLLGILMATA
jgi:hypothetical protein